MLAFIDKIKGGMKQATVVRAGLHYTIFTVGWIFDVGDLDWAELHLSALISQL